MCVVELLIALKKLFKSHKKSLIVVYSVSILSGDIYTKQATNSNPLSSLHQIMFKANWASRMGRSDKAAPATGTTEKRSSRAKDAKRTKVIATLSAPLDWNDLELLATWLIPQTVADTSGLVFRGLASRADRTELGCMCSWLVHLVATSVDLPTDVLAEVHFFIGLIREEFQEYPAATQSFLNCLFLQSQQKEDPEKVAKTLYRLGNSYGRQGLLDEKKSSWKRAFEFMGDALTPDELESLCSRRGLQMVEEETASSDFYE